MLELIDWTTFTVLLAAGFLGSQAVAPLNQSIQKLTQGDAKTVPGSRSQRMIGFLNAGINLVVIAIAIIGGLLFTALLKTVGVPLVESALTGSPAPSLWATVAVPIMAGLSLGVVLSLSALYRPNDRHVDFYSISIWRRLLAGVLHGGIVEELVFRWFLLSFIVWLLSLFSGFAGDATPNNAFWIANTIAALLFGLMHVPGSAATGPLTGITIFLVMALNTLVGLVYGYLFWQHGLEAAVFAHMSTHLALQPCATLLLRVVSSRRSMPPIPKEI
ncbi:MAG: CPBP family intramembrane metalloprotease [Gammaproteobacteria bacterium]|nr:CPBP family intramembrane metalloprotease [Gammaproteobacteria bacterium]